MRNIMIAAMLVLSPMQCDTKDSDLLTDIETVNNLPYAFGNMESPMSAYHTVARHIGWSDEKTSAWEPFIFDIISKESGGCWNIKGGTRFNAFGDDCLFPSHWGKASDSGFGQLISLWYKGSKAPLCAKHGFCSQGSIIGSPWASMDALLRAIDIDGSHPWCYSKKARKFHTCSLAPNR